MRKCNNKMRKCNNIACPNRHLCQRYDKKATRLEAISLRLSDLYEFGVFACQFFMPKRGLK